MAELSPVGYYQMPKTALKQQEASANESIDQYMLMTEILDITVLSSNIDLAICALVLIAKILTASILSQLNIFSYSHHRLFRLMLLFAVIFPKAVLFKYTDDLELRRSPYL